MRTTIYTHRVPACPLDPKVVIAERRPARFVQLYWRLASCRQAADAWPFLPTPYIQDNVPGGTFDAFKRFIDTHSRFEVLEARGTIIKPSTSGDGSKTAKLQIDLIYYDSEDDSVPCTIDYVLTKNGGDTPWLFSSSDGDVC